VEPVWGTLRNKSIRDGGKLHGRVELTVPTVDGKGRGDGGEWRRRENGREMDSDEESLLCTSYLRWFAWLAR
jgi:hypothetical protein